MTRFFALLSGGVLVAASSLTMAAPAIALPAHHGCTRTSTGHCIRAGEYCRKSQRGQYGWDAYGHRLRCYGTGTPHWHHA